MRILHLDVEIFFWERVLKTDDCWNWVGCIERDGYGRIKSKINGIQFNAQAHIISWMIHYNQRPDLHLLHSCDNRKCVNPSHLLLGTQADNMKDMVLKNRSAKGTKQHLAKIDDSDVRMIRDMYKSGLHSYAMLAAEFHLDKSTISDIVNHLTWRHVP